MNVWLQGALIAAVIGTFSPAAAEQATGPSEHQVKAAMLYNFAKFVEWPDDVFTGPAAPLTIGILGADPFGRDIDAVAARTIKGRPVEVRRFRKSEDVTYCHILFVGSLPEGQAAAHIRNLRRRGMLLVGDREQFIRQGGMINFLIKDDAVSFEVNVEAVQGAGMRIHPRVLNMARIVHEQAP